MTHGHHTAHSLFDPESEEVRQELFSENVVDDPCSQLTGDQQSPAE